MTESTSPAGDDERLPGPDVEPPEAPATSPIPLDEDEIRERADQTDDDATDSLI
ncbi:hypothetical protein [Microbacterium sp. A1-JK]|uniref:hypothetical protein n=1 Tax=Microbacterium sp. A1-JK TaxID=3177516 RepID=UPI00388A02F2